MSNLIVAKWGGGILSTKPPPEQMESNYTPTINIGVIESLCRQTKLAYEMNMRVAEEFGNTYIVLTHGAGGFGHYKVHKLQLPEKNIPYNDKKKVDEVNESVGILNNQVVYCMRKQGLPVEIFNVPTMTTMKNGMISNADTKALEISLKRGDIPCLYGSIANEEDGTYSICSMDAMTVYLAKQLSRNLKIKNGNTRIMMVTDVGGLYTSDPTKDINAELIRTVDHENVNYVKKCLSGSSGVDYTGGMRRKFNELWESKFASKIIGTGYKEGYTSNPERGDFCKSLIEHTIYPLEEDNITGTYIYPKKNYNKYWKKIFGDDWKVKKIAPLEKVNISAESDFPNKIEIFA